MSKLDYLSNQMAAGLFMVALFTSEKKLHKYFLFLCFDWEENVGNLWKQSFIGMSLQPQISQPKVVDWVLLLFRLQES
jgi:hypothetical protein